MTEMVLGVRSSAWSKKGTLFGEVPSAAIEFGAADPDAEIERIKAHLVSIGVDLALQW